MLHLLSVEQKSNIIVCQNLQKHLQRDPQFFSKVVTDGYTEGALRWRRFGDIITMHQSEAALARFRTQDFCRRLQQRCNHWTLHQVTKEVLQKGQHGIESAFSYHREKNLIWTFFITPHKKLIFFTASTRFL